MAIPLKQYGDLLARYLKPQWVRVVLLAVVLLGSIALQLVNPQIVRYFIDTATSGGAVEGLVAAAGFFLGIALFTQVLQVLATYLGENVGWTATNLLRVDLALHCLRLDMPFHKTHTPGEMIERIDGDVTALSRFFSQFVINVLGNAVLMLGVLVLLFKEDWRIGVALSAFAVLAVFLLNKSRNVAVPSITEARQASAEQFGFLEERLAGLPDIRANGAGAHVMRGMTVKMREMYHKGRKEWQMDAVLWMLTIGLFTAGYVIAFSVGASLFGAGAISLGTMYLFFQYTEMLRHPLDQITEQLRELQRATAGIGRVQQLYDIPVEILDGPGAAFPEGPLSVEFRDVSFAYSDSDDRPQTAVGSEQSAVGLNAKQNRQSAQENTQYESSSDLVLKDLSFRLEPGRVLGLLGRTGSGKTTITRLLFRLYDPAEGTITLGGQELSDATLDDLRKHIGMVTQDVQLFGATVRDNLTLFDHSIPDERIHEVLRDLGLWNWYSSLPNGLDTELGHGGGGLSAGEAQLLAFTRVFLKDPGLVILDEASSRLDPATEQLIERAVGKLLRNRTGIIIAHRLPTVQRADEILILDDGQILEHGPRARLAGDPKSHFAHLLRTGLEEVLA